MLVLDICKRKIIMKKFIKSLLVLALFATSTSEIYASYGRRSSTSIKNGKKNTQTQTLTGYLSTLVNDYKKVINYKNITSKNEGNDCFSLTIPLTYETKDSNAISQLTDAIIKICNRTFTYCGTSQITDINTSKLVNYLTKYLARKQRAQVIITTKKDNKLDTSTKEVENVGSLTHTYSREGAIGGYHCKVYCYARSNVYNILTTAKKASAQIEITLTVPSSLTSKNNQ